MKRKYPDLETHGSSIIFSTKQGQLFVYWSQSETQMRGYDGCGQILQAY